MRATYLWLVRFVLYRLPGEWTSKARSGSATYQLSIRTHVLSFIDD